MVKLSPLGISHGKSQDSWIDHGRNYSNENSLLTKDEHIHAFPPAKAIW